jgi:hypothetical protein
VWQDLCKTGRKLFNMHKIYFLAFLLSGTVAVSQTTSTNTKTDELNCYNKWAAKFDERGADEVGDGVYDDVIITVRQGNKAECYNGRVEVKEKKVVTLSIQREDGTYDELKWKWKSDPKSVIISNGISSTLISNDGKLVNVVWPKKIKAKKAPFKKAPEPTDD